MLFTETTFQGGLELVLAPRSYTPPTGVSERSRLSAIPVPSLGAATRLASRGGRGPLPVSFGLALYNSGGGALEFDPQAVQPGITSSRIVLLEVTSALAYQVNARLAVGISLRVGVGTFDLTNTEERGVMLRPSELGGSGVGVGASVGATFRAHERLRLGVVYASPLRSTMKGEGNVEVQPKTWRSDRISLSIPWPQWAAIGTALKLRPSLELLAGLRWTDWSAVRELVVDLTLVPDVVEPLALSDGISAHLGLEWVAHHRLTLRGGLAYDNNTVPDTTIKRQYLDAHKLTVAVGASVTLYRGLALDLAYELLAGPSREVPDPTREELDPRTGSTVVAHANAAPGRYSSQVHSIALGVRYAY
jgi:long-subunit fatty acid transport protein